MDVGDVGAGFRRRSGGEAKSEITRGNRRMRRDDIGGSSQGSDRNKSAQLGSGSAIWLSGNLEFFKKAKSAVYSTCHEYVVSFCGQCEEGVRTSSSGISNRRTVLIRLRKVRIVCATPAF
jgi:hypothetical protein